MEMDWYFAILPPVRCKRNGDPRKVVREEGNRERKLYAWNMHFFHFEIELGVLERFGNLHVPG